MEKIFMFNYNYFDYNLVQFWFDLINLWTQIAMETRALREAHNQNKKRLENVERILRADGRL